MQATKQRTIALTANGGLSRRGPSKNHTATPADKIILPGWAEITFEPGYDPEAKAELEELVYSGKLADQFREHGLSKHLIDEYLAAVERRNMEVANVIN